MTDLPPKPGHTITFTMPLSMSTLKVNRLIQDTVNTVLLDMLKAPVVDVALRGAEANYRRDTSPTRYVHGFGTDLRVSLVADYTPTTGLLTVHYPPNYWGEAHPSTDDWMRARVRIWDALIFAIGGPNGVGGVTQSVT